MGAESGRPPRTLPADPAGRTRLSSAPRDCTSWPPTPDSHLEAPLHKRSLRLLSGLVALGLLTAACGNDDDTEHRRHRPPPAPTTTTTTVADERRRLPGLARRSLPGGQGRRRRGPRRLHRPPRHRHRQGRRPHLQPVRLRGHDRGRGVLRLRDRLHRDGVRGRLREEHRHGARGRPRRASSRSASCSPRTRWPRPRRTPTRTSSASTSSSPSYPDNYVGVLFNEDEGGYMAGVLAASLSESGVIGVVGGRRGRPAGRQAGQRLRGRRQVGEPRHPAC